MLHVVLSLRSKAIVRLVALCLMLPIMHGVLAQQVADWPVVGSDNAGSRYSPLSDIDRGNVHRLKLAWTYRHGDYRAGWPESDLKGTAFEATPLMVDRRLIFSTPFNRVIALDPGTGKALWIFDPKIDRSRRYANKYVSRGVAYWRDTTAQGACAARVYLGTLDARLFALDAVTGKPCEDFGDHGVVNLLEGLAPMIDPWEYNVTSPPTIVGDRVIVGAAIADLIRRIQPPGAVRAFDARSGKLLWRFDTIPRAGEFGVDTWANESWRDAGGASVWSLMTADEQRGLVYLPVKPVGPDHYGGDRPGDNLFSNSLVALDVATGKRVWHFQAIHHDVWDYDLARRPTWCNFEAPGGRWTRLRYSRRQDSSLYSIARRARRCFRLKSGRCRTTPRLAEKYFRSRNRCRRSRRLWCRKRCAKTIYGTNIRIAINVNRDWRVCAMTACLHRRPRAAR